MSDEADRERGGDAGAVESCPAPVSGSSPLGPAPDAVMVEVFGLTDVGRVREHNEDSFLVADLTLARRSLSDGPQEIGEGGMLLGVCDGMGGAQAGEVASQLAVDAVYEFMQAADPPRDAGELAQRLVHALESAGLRIWREARLERTHRGMGTTATIAVLRGGSVFFGQVGDSRAYVLRDGRLVQVTRDQSLANQLFESGQLTADELETFEHNNIILQALGTVDSVQVDLTHVELRRGDTLMLCSDGLSGMLREGEIRKLLSIDDPGEACRTLAARANEEGGRDNVTVVVAKVRGGLPAPTPGDIDGLAYRKHAFARTSGASPEADQPAEGRPAADAPGAAESSGERPPSAPAFSEPPSPIPLEASFGWLVALALTGVLAGLVTLGTCYLG